MADKKSNKKVWIITTLLIVTAIFLITNFREITGQQLRLAQPYVSQQIGIHVDDFIDIRISSADTSTLKLVNVGEGGTIVVDVDGILGTILLGSTKLVRCLSITNLDTYYHRDKSKRMAYLSVDGRASECFPGEGIFVDSYFYAGHKKIKLVNVGEGGAIVVDVDGILDTILARDIKCIDSIPIRNRETYYFSAKEKRRAVIEVGNIRKECHPTGDSILVDEDINIDGKKLTLLNVGEGGSVVIKVDGITDTINRGSTKVINCLTITNLESYYFTEKEYRAAYLDVNPVC